MIAPKFTGKLLIYSKNIIPYGLLKGFYIPWEYRMMACKGLKIAISKKIGYTIVHEIPLWRYCVK